MSFQWFQSPELEKNSLFFFSSRAVELNHILQTEGDIWQWSTHVKDMF